MNIADVVQNVIVSRKNPTIEDLLDHHTNAVDFKKTEYHEDLPF